MTRNGAHEILVASLLVSAALHIGLMLYARQKVMTNVLSSSVASAHRPAMKVTRNLPPADAMKIAELLDVEASKDAPAAVPVKDAPTLAAPRSDEDLSKGLIPADPTDASEAPKPVPEAVKMDAAVLSSPHSPEILKIGPATAAAPRMAGALAAPEAGPVVAAPHLENLPAVPKALSVEDPFAAGTRLVRARDVAAEESRPFVPEETVREKIDERLVEREKQAVRELLDVDETRDLVKFVSVSAASASQGGWNYFKLKLKPKKGLPTVSKDLVVLIDASGSIGRDRIRSIREAAKGVLRTGLNAGDRFNLVAFRDKYSYAFRAWQPCTQSAFDKADAWLGEVAAHGRTDVFGTISSVLTLPRTPERPLVAMVVTDGEANVGVSETAEILSRFTRLNGGLVSVYMYGVKSSANRELIDVLTHGNRGESLVYDGWLKWKAGAGISGFTERFRDPVLSDLRILFAANARAEAYPRLLRNLYRDDTLVICGRVPSGVESVSFSLKGLNGKDLYEGYFTVPLSGVPFDASAYADWEAERKIDRKL